MRQFLSTTFVLMALVGCAIQPPEIKAVDWRIGTNSSPLRSIASVLICDDCTL